MSDEAKLSSSWFVYILRCGDGSLYTGVTTDPERRLRQHRGEIRGGARYTRARLPIDMIYLEPQANRSNATKREAEIKRLKAKDKEALIFKQTEPEDFSS